MMRRPPRSTLFPNPTLSRSLEKVEVTADGGSRYAQLVRDAGDVHAAVPGQPLQDRLQPLRLPHRTGLRIPQAAARPGARPGPRSEEHTSELQSQSNLVCRLL